MRHLEGMREAPPDSVKERREPSIEAIPPLPERATETAAAPKAVLGLLELPDIQGELPPFRSVFEDDEPTMDEMPFDDVPAELKGFLQKVASSRWAKMLGIAGLFGASIETANAFQAASERQETRVEVAASVHNIALESRIEHALQQLEQNIDLPSANEVITLADGRTMPRSERLHELNTEYTDNAKEAGIFNYLKDQCSPDAKTLDMEECYAKYGDQMPLSPEGVAALAEATGYSPEELALHGMTIRQSVVTRGESFGSIAPMPLYHADEIASSFGHERQMLYRDHYAQASKLILTTVRALDLPHASSADQQEAVTTLAHVLRSEIDLTNALTRVANDIGNINNTEAQQSLITGLPTANGEVLSDMSRLDLAEFQVASGWKKLASMESSATGTLHELSTLIQQERDLQRHELFSQGQQLDVLPDFFAEQTATR